MKVGRRLVVLLAVVGATALALVVSRATPSANAAHATVGAAKSITIWTDSYRKAAVDKITSQWGTARGVNVNVTVKPFGNIQQDLTNATEATGADIIVGAHDWTGAMAANGSVVPIILKKAIKKQFPAYALGAESYGGKLYGLPTQLENVGLVVNTSLAKIPKTFAQLEKEALAFKHKASGNIAIAVPQGSGGDAYHMYPFFSGLCGYVFGKSANGALNPNKLGIANPTFLKNSKLIDKWNSEGLIDSRVAYGDAKNAFLNKKAAFWITGPWETSSLNSSGLPFRIIQVPKIKCRAVPFLGVQGFYVTKFAAGHGVDALAKDLVENFMSKAGAQYDLAIANSRFPANKLAGKRVNDPVLAQFGRAGAGGVPMPNIPQMGSVWADLGGAWVKATKGPGATPARVAFTTAARNIAAKIAGG